MRFSELCGFFPKQAEATKMADQFRYFLYGGARGPGKSYWLRWYLVRLLLKWAAEGHRGVRVMLACEDFPSLRGRQVTKIATQMPLWLGEVANRQEDGFGFFLRPEYGNGAIIFANLDDPTKYQSQEFAAIAIDELTKNAQSTFDILRGSLRWPGIEDTHFVAASNSNGPGQKWVRDYWIEGLFPDELESKRGEFGYLPALPDDNPHLPQSYWEELNTLTGALRRSWLLADWYAMFEGLVYDEFDQDNVTDEEPDPDQPVELAFDDGYIDPRAILFIQRTSTGVLVFDELYHSRHLAAVCVEEVVNRCGKWWGWVEDDDGQVVEPKIPKKRPEIAVGSPEAIELRERLRRGDIPTRNEPHKIVDGIQVVRRLVKDGAGYRALKVHRRCVNLLRELREGYKYPDGSKARRDEEIPLDKDNHAADALRYWAYVRARR